MEQVVIRKDLTLVGTGAGSTTIQAPAALTPSSFGSTSIIFVTDAAHATIAGITVSGPGPGTCSSLTLGISVAGDATLDLKDSVVSHIRDNPLSACNFGAAVGVGVPSFMNGGSVGHATIHNSVFFDYQSEAIGVVGPGSTATITDNMIVGSGFSTVRPQNGIFITRSATATVKSNVIKNNLCDIPAFCGNNPMGQNQSAGIFAANAGPGTAISENSISSNDVGVYIFLGANCCEVEENQLRDNRYFGIILQDGDNSASENRIVGGQSGIGVVADFINTKGTLEENKILKPTVTPVAQLSCCGVQATVVNE